METVIRKYSGKGSAELFTLLERSKTEIESLMRTVPGFVSYTLVRSSGAGGFSITTCQDQAGIADSSRKAKEWVAKNAGNLGTAAPEVSAGSVVFQLK